MPPQTFVHCSRISAPAAQVFAWHERPGAFERLTPPWSPAEVVARSGGIEDGAEVTIKIPVGPFHVRWRARHGGYEAGRCFRDTQVEGPFARWEHTHSMEPDGDQACFLEDRIEYALPFGALGRVCGTPFVDGMLHRLFTYRHRITEADMLAHASATKPLGIAITGASGLIGSQLMPFLTTGGHCARPMMRSRSGAREGALFWNPDTKEIDVGQLEGLDAVVHLAGENVGSGRWTDAKKAAIRDSRVNGTRFLCDALARLESPPRTLVCASGIGFYGDRGDELLSEDSETGGGFLSEVCQAWEAAAEPARRCGIRVVHLRFGVVLTPVGGALQRTLLPFRLGAGGSVGSGEQYMSWIAIDDAIGAIYHALLTDSLSGAVNAVAPTPVTNREFTKTLGRVLSRPTLLPMPAVAARLAFGEMADELLLASIRVRPGQLPASGYQFQQLALEPALRHLLGR
jgi:uncharacterized protein (TIGR01777 family)